MREENARLKKELKHLLQREKYFNQRSEGSIDDDQEGEDLDDDLVRSSDDESIMENKG